MQKHVRLQRINKKGGFTVVLARIPNYLSYNILPIQMTIDELAVMDNWDLRRLLIDKANNLKQLQPNAGTSSQLNECARDMKLILDIYPKAIILLEDCLNKHQQHS